MKKGKRFAETVYVDFLKMKMIVNPKTGPSVHVVSKEWFEELKNIVSKAKAERITFQSYHQSYIKHEKDNDAARVKRLLEHLHK